MKLVLVLVLLLASVGCYLLLTTVLWLGLQVLEMNQWQGALLGIAMWTLVIVTPTLAVLGIWRGVKAFKNRRRAIQSRELSISSNRELPSDFRTVSFGHDGHGPRSLDASCVPDSGDAAHRLMLAAPFYRNRASENKGRV